MRSLRTTFSHVAAFSPTLARSIVSRVSPTMRNCDTSAEESGERSTPCTRISL